MRATRKCTAAKTNAPESARVTSKVRETSSTTTLSTTWASSSPPATCRRCSPMPVAGGLELAQVVRSEEHTSELQSRQYLVCRLLLEKRNTQAAYGLALSSAQTAHLPTGNACRGARPPRVHPLAWPSVKRRVFYTTVNSLLDSTLRI